MKKIKVLEVTGGLGVGGIEKLVTSFLELLDLKKYEIDFLVYGDKIGEFEENVKSHGSKIIRIPTPGKGYNSFYKNLLKIMKENGQYDIVHSHTLFNSGIVLKAAYKCNVKIRIAHSHDNLYSVKDSFVRKIYIALMRKLIIKYSTIMCACSSLAGNYLFGSNIFKKEGVVLYNGIDIDKFLFNEKIRSKIRRDLKVENNILIGTIGRIEMQKNHVFLIELAKRLPDKYKFIVVGDGSLFSEFLKKIEHEGLFNRFILTGERNDIRNLLCAMDLFVLPSIHEGLGIVLIEAQANGLQCIAPDNVVPPEAKVLDNFIFSTFPNNEHVSDWVNCIKKCSFKREKQCGEILKKSGYDYKDIGKKLDQIYSIKK